LVTPLWGWKSYLHVLNIKEGIILKFRKITVFTLVLMLMMVALAGCGNQASSEKSKVADENKQPVVQSEKSLLVYSGAGLSKPMTEIGKAFEKQTGVKVTYNFAGSAQLLSQMELSKEGDVFIPRDVVDMEKAKSKGFVSEYKKVVYHIPVIGVPKGNPAQIGTLADLAKPGVKVIIGDEKACAIGKMALKIFTKNNLWSDVEKNVVVRDATLNEVVVHTAMKQGDASIITEDCAINAKDIDYISIPEEQNVIEIVPIGALGFSKETELAQQFVDFVASDAGKAIYKKHGFKPVQ